MVWKKSSLGWINEKRKEEIEFMKYKTPWASGTVAIVEVNDITNGRKGFAQIIFEQEFKSMSKATAHAKKYMRNNP